MCQVNNSVTFSAKPIGPEEFFNRIVETLDNTIDRRPEGRLHKMESQTMQEQGTIFCSYLPPLKPFICKALEPPQEYPLNARRVPLKGYQFSKKRQLRRFF